MKTETPPVRMGWFRPITQPPIHKIRRMTFDGTASLRSGSIPLTYVQSVDEYALMRSKEPSKIISPAPVTGNVQMVVRKEPPLKELGIDLIAFPGMTACFSNSLKISRHKISAGLFHIFLFSPKTNLCDLPPIPTSQLSPVYYLSWVEAFEFCSWLSERTGMSFRLPTVQELDHAFTYLASHLIIDPDIHEMTGDILPIMYAGNCPPPERRITVAPPGPKARLNTLRYSFIESNLIGSSKIGFRVVAQEA